MPSSAPKRLLIVDDDPGLSRLIQKSLTREGFFCAIATSGGEAIRILECESVDLLLLDLKLQDTSAAEFIEKLAPMGRRTPFLIITGQGDERMAVDMMKRGALDYVVKDRNFLQFLPTLVHHAIAQIKRENRLSVAESAVIEKERRYRETLDAMMEGCQTLGLDWRYLYVNEAAARHGRRPPSELLGRTIMEVYPGIESTPIFLELAKSMKDRTPRNLENAFHYGDSDSAWFQLSVQPVPEGLFILSLDITKRKEAERCRNLQYDVAQLLAKSTSLSEAALRVLEQVCGTMGWRTGEFWSVQRDSNLLNLLCAWPLEDTPSLWGELTKKQTMEMGSGIPGRVAVSRTQVFIANVTTDDKCERRELSEKLGMRSAFAFPVSVRDEVLGVLVFFGNVTHPPDDDLSSCFAAIGRDISQFIERKTLEREVLEISHKEQNRLGRDLHDGLGQQLTALELFSVRLAVEADGKSRTLGKKVRKMGEHLRDAIKQTRGMANGLSPISLNEGSLVTALNKLAEGTRAMANVDCELICPTPIEIDLESGIHLYRIAQETTNNALKHGRARKIRISLTEQNNRELHLAVSDNGQGFAMSEAIGGGMGLRVMKYRASLIGAELNIESEVGKGTCVTCVLRKCP